MKINHYGITVDSEIPVTGVVNNNKPEWLYEEIAQGLNVNYEEHCKECTEEYHDNCWEDNPTDTILIGYTKDNLTGLYEPDKDAEFSAIVTEIYCQVTASNYVSRCNLCSPCFPGQGDLETTGEFLTFTLPPEVWGEVEHLEIHKYESNNNREQ